MKFEELPDWVRSGLAACLERDGYLSVDAERPFRLGEKIIGLRGDGLSLLHPFVVVGDSTEAEWMSQQALYAHEGGWWGTPAGRYFYRIMTD